MTVIQQAEERLRRLILDMEIGPGEAPDGALARRADRGLAKLYPHGTGSS